MQIDGEGDETLLNLGEWFRYYVDIDLPLLSLPYDEKVMIVDLSTQHPTQGTIVFHTCFQQQSKNTSCCAE